MGDSMSIVTVTFILYLKENLIEARILTKINVPSKISLETLTQLNLQWNNQLAFSASLLIKHDQYKQIHHDRHKPLYAT